MRGRLSGRTKFAVRPAMAAAMTIQNEVNGSLTRRKTARSPLLDIRMQCTLRDDFPAILRR